MEHKKIGSLAARLFCVEMSYFICYTDRMNEKIRRDTMAKLNNLKKVELLENTILEGNIECVKEVFAQQAPFEFTARALGLACRFVGAEMVKCLIELGIDFGYEFKSTLFSKYNCRHQLSNSTSVPVNYSRYALSMQPSWNDAEKDRFSAFTLLPAEKRAEVVGVLCENSERIHFNPSELLYYAALLGDAQIFRALKAAGIELSVYRRELLDGTLKYNRLDTEGRFHLEGISAALSSEQDDVFALRLNMLIECLGGGKLMLSKDAYYESWKEVFLSRWCAPAVFITALKHTNLTERVKQWELIEGLIDCGNAEGLSHVLGQEWLKKSEDFKKLFELAEKKNADAAVMACILQYHNPAAHASEEAADELSLDLKPLSAAELKKLWNSKKREDGTLELTSYKGTETYIIVPDIIGKTPVTALGEEVFSPNAARLTKEQIDARINIRCVEIPSSIKKLPDGLFRIGFAGTRPALEEVILNEGLEEIGRNALYGCTGLKEITLPQSLKIIGANALYGCTALEKIVVPESATQIDAGAFGGCTKLEEVKLPSALTHLPSSLFNKCTSLKQIDLPEGIWELPSYVFSQCGFEEYTVPKGITKIGGFAFFGCKKLKKITLPEGVTIISNYAFCECPMKEIILPDSVEEIGSFAFTDCKHLERVTMPEGVDIGDQAFAGCVKLKDEQGLIVAGGILQSFEGDITQALRLSSKVEKVSDSVLRTLPRIVYRPCEDIGVLPDVSALNVGDEVEFGRFPQDNTLEMKPLVWQVIAQEGNRRLLMTKQAIIGISPECRLGQKGTWADSEVRAWLNSVFLETVFTQEERTHIPEVLLTNPNNRKTSPVTKGGEDTLDRVFLLSYDELMQYLPEDRQQCAEVTPYAKAQWKAKRDVHFYRLRTPASHGPVCASCYIGGCIMTGNHVGVAVLRPAVWVE